MRVRFDEVFNVIDGRIQPKGKVKIGGIIMTPAVTMRRTGVMISGVNLAQCVGKDLDIEKHPDGTIEVKDVFQ